VATLLFAAEDEYKDTRRLAADFYHSSEIMHPSDEAIVLTRNKHGPL
jgi:hypothetical protein